MEIRNIDPKDESKITLHAGALGTTKIVRQRQLRHSSLPQAPAPNPLQHLMDRAFELNAGVVDHRHPTSHERATSFDGPPATSYFVTKDDKGREVWWNPTSKSYEVKARQHAEIVRTDVLASNLNCQSAPDNPAPIQINQHAEAADTLAISSKKNHNTQVVLDRRPAPTNDELESAGSLSSPLTRRLQSLKGFLLKLFVKIKKKSAYHNPNLIRTNFGWVRREDYEGIK